MVSSSCTDGAAWRYIMLKKKKRCDCIRIVHKYSYLTSTDVRNHSSVSTLCMLNRTRDIWCAHFDTWFGLNALLPNQQPTCIWHRVHRSLASLMYADVPLWTQTAEERRHKDICIVWISERTFNTYNMMPDGCHLPQLFFNSHLENTNGTVHMETGALFTSVA